jgi:invasion protein IalB
MKNLIAVLALSLFTATMSVNAQEKKPKATDKKEATKETKSCDKEKKAGCCAKMAEKK